jgi:phytoene synthase
MDLYTQTSYKLSKIITRDYSTSFSLGIHMLSRKHHAAIYAIYGFVRLADEIVDTFHDKDKNELLQRFKLETDRALSERISTILYCMLFRILYIVTVSIDPISMLSYTAWRWI